MPKWFVSYSFESSLEVEPCSSKQTAEQRARELRRVAGVRGVNVYSEPSIEDQMRREEDSTPEGKGDDLSAR